MRMLTDVKGSARRTVVQRTMVVLFQCEKGIDLVSYNKAV
jgi:hypothetical protein